MTAALTSAPLRDAAARWRAQTLRGVYRLLVMLIVLGIPFYQSTPRLEIAVRLAVFLAGARFAGDPRWTRPWSAALCVTLLAMAARSLLTGGPSPGNMVALASSVLLGLAFLGPIGAAVFYAAGIALPFVCFAIIQAGLLPAPAPWEFASPVIWGRAAVNLLLFALALAYTVSSVLRQLELGVAQRGLSISRLRREHASRTAAEASRDAAASALESARRQELLGQLTAGVAHDFNNMLVVILTWADLLRSSTSTAAERAEAAREILFAAERASALASQLVSVGRIETGRKQPTDLADLGAELLRSLQRLVTAPIEVRQARLDPAPTLGVPAHLQQVLLNFALNARDAMPEGGAITLSSGPATPDEVGGLQVPCVALRVHDAGVGIDEASLGQVFEPFFTTKGQGAGLGLGLASALAIAEAHGGRIDVKSAPGRGSTFALVLPRAPAFRAPLSVPASVRRQEGERTVLLVDDELQVRQVMARALRAAGLQVLEAADGGAGLARIAAGQPLDLLCVDGILPDLPSRQLIDAFAAAWPKAKVLICSGHVDSEVLRAQIAEGRYAFLPKPFGSETLVQEVTGLLWAGAPEPVGQA